jgi:murein tripeptide amidase MpaA
MVSKRVFYLRLLFGLLALTWTSLTVSAAENGITTGNINTRKIIKIYVQSKEEINELANIVAPWEVHKDYIITDVNDSTIQQIRDRGFTVEVLFESYQEFMKSYDKDLPRAGPEGLYHSYSEIRDELQQLAFTYPQIAKVYDIGDSWEKTQGIADRDIWAIKISDNVALEEDEAEILFIGSHHAREWISVEVPFYLAKYLVENYDTDPLIRSYIDNGEIWIVPMLNPDGHQYSIDVYRMWRKNRRNNGGGIYGVDLNRNYSYMWGGPGSSGNPSSNIYRGPAPFSEPETQAIRNLALNHDFQAIMSYHSYGQLILYPWSYTSIPAPDEESLRYLATEMSDLIYAVHGKYYDPIQSSELYLASGVTQDWAYGELGIFCFTIELRPVGFPGFILPESEIIPTWEENRPAALYLINWTQLPETPITDIKANGLDGFITINQSDNLSITVALDPGAKVGRSADWWALALTPYGWYYYNLSTVWLPGIFVTYQGPLGDVAPYEILNYTGLPTGSYTFYFGVDMIMNSFIDVGPLYYDSVAVTITP